MNIDLYLYASLTKYLPADATARHVTVSVPAGATPGQLAQQFGVPEEEVKLVFVNGVRRDLDAALSDGDRVGLFPPVGGG